MIRLRSEVCVFRMERNYIARTLMYGDAHEQCLYYYVYDIVMKYNLLFDDEKCNLK